MTARVLPLDLGDEPPRVGDMDLALGLRGVFSCCVGASAAALTALGVNRDVQREIAGPAVVTSGAREGLARWCPHPLVDPDADVAG